MAHLVEHLTLGFCSSHVLKFVRWALHGVPWWELSMLGIPSPSHSAPFMLTLSPTQKEKKKYTAYLQQDSTLSAPKLITMVHPGSPQTFWEEGPEIKYGKSRKKILHYWGKNLFKRWVKFIVSSVKIKGHGNKTLTITKKKKKKYLPGTTCTMV